VYEHLCRAVHDEGRVQPINRQVVGNATAPARADAGDHGDAGPRLNDVADPECCGVDKRDLRGVLPAPVSEVVVRQAETLVGWPLPS
jgi:hypothetical protein